MLAKAVTMYSTALDSDIDTVMYLDARGIDEETAAIARLGVVTDPAPGHEKFRGMLAIPYLDKDGEPLTVRFRCIQDHDHREYKHGKYMSLPGDPGRMFSIGSIFRAGNEIHICEGEMDCLVLNKIGRHAVAMPGATTWRPRHRRMLAGFSRVWVWGDPDEAGAEMVAKVTQSLRSAIPLQLEADVNDTYLAGGKEALERVLAKGRKSIE